MADFQCARQQLSLAKFEASFNTLVDKYPQSERCMRVTRTAHAGRNMYRLWYSLWVRGGRQELKMPFCIICRAFTSEQATHRRVVVLRYHGVSLGRYCWLCYLSLLSCRGWVAAGYPARVAHRPLPLVAS